METNTKSTPFIDEAKGSRSELIKIEMHFWRQMQCSRTLRWKRWGNGLKIEGGEDGHEIRAFSDLTISKPFICTTFTPKFSKYHLSPETSLIHF